MIGFEDAVNMAEETKDPVRIFPKILLGGICLTGVIYVLVALTSVALVPTDELGEGDTPLLKVVEAGAPGFPLGIFAVIAMCAVANSALINMLMASRLLYGMSNERVLPRVFGRVHPGRRTPWVAVAFTTLLAFGLITFVGEISERGGTTAPSTRDLPPNVVLAVSGSRPPLDARDRAPVMLQSAPLSAPRKPQVTLPPVANWYMTGARARA